MEVDWQEVCSPLEDPLAPIRGPSETEPTPPSLSEVMLTVLDWYASHKQTYTATEDIYRILRLVVPPGTTIGTFKQMREILDRHRLASCCVFDACPTGCVVYANLSTCKYADLTQCPVCESPRFVGMGAHIRVAHTIYFFPIAKYLRDMHSRTDLAEYMDHRPSDATPASSVKRSRVYRDKIINNPDINTDIRNHGIILSADGIPYFGSAGKHSRGAWPVLARLASLPDGLWDRFEYAHLYALEAQEHWYTDVETGKVLRKRRSEQLAVCACSKHLLCIKTQRLCFNT